jgi:hypothetical protein
MNGLFVPEGEVRTVVALTDEAHGSVLTLSFRYDRRDARPEGLPDALHQIYDLNNAAISCVVDWVEFRFDRIYWEKFYRLSGIETRFSAEATIEAALPLLDGLVENVGYGLVLAEGVKSTAAPREGIWGAVADFERNILELRAPGREGRWIRLADGVFLLVMGDSPVGLQPVGDNAELEENGFSPCGLRPVGLRVEGLNLGKLAAAVRARRKAEWRKAAEGRAYSCRRGFTRFWRRFSRLWRG